MHVQFVCLFRRLQQPRREEPGAAQAAEEALQSRLLPRTGLRAGAPLQPPAVPLRARAGGPGGLPETNRDTGQDLVPEPPLQDETPADGRRLDGIHPGGQKGSGEGSSAGRPETVRPRGDPAAPAALPAAFLLLPVRILPPCVDTVCVCGESVRTLRLLFIIHLFASLPGNQHNFTFFFSDKKKSPEGNVNQLCVPDLSSGCF